MSPEQTEKVVEKLRTILDEVPKDYTGRLVLGIDFQSGGIGRNTIRVTKDVRILPVLGPVNA